MKKLIVILLTLLMTACSSQFAYNNLDWLIHWYLDDYIDLTKPQKTQFDEQFAIWHQWHREQELQIYVAHLQEVKAQLSNRELSPQMIQAHFEQARGHWERLRQQITPDIARLSEALNKEQVEKLFAELEEKNSEAEQERLAMEEQELQALFEEQYNDRLRDYFGRLTDAQQALVAEAAKEVKSNRIEWIIYKRNVQQNAKQLLLRKDSNPNFVNDFTALLQNPEQYQHALYVENMQHNRQVFSQLLFDVVNTLSDKQMRRLVRKIDGYIEDFTELAEDV